MKEKFEEIEFFFLKTAAVAVAFCAMSTAQYFFFSRSFGGVNVPTVAD